VRRKLILAGVLAGSIAIGAVANGATVIRGVSTDAGYRWKPKLTEVAKGTKVTWRAVDGSHTVTAYKGPWSKSATIAQGGTTSFTFRRVGNFRFRCTFHSSLVDGKCTGMCGRVLVG
jgi:plastocyanin